MINIPVSTTTSYQVRIDGAAPSLTVIERNISATDLTHIEAAEIVTYQQCPWIRTIHESTKLIERQSTWRIYHLFYQRPGEEQKYLRVSVTPLQ